MENFFIVDDGMDTLLNFKNNIQKYFIIYFYICINIYTMLLDFKKYISIQFCFHSKQIFGTLKNKIL